MITQNLADVVVLSQNICKFPILGNLAYATPENFLGTVVDGYSPDAQDVCLLGTAAANALCEVQRELNQSNLGLLIYDAYRPLRAVRHFAEWFNEATAGEFELVRKKIHYPNLLKTELVSQGYAPDLVSRHNFANSVDLTIINLETLLPLSMGACFDYFDEISHNTADAHVIGVEAYNNRCLLRDIMEKNKFIAYAKEFWHFDYQIREFAEPLDIPIDANLRGLNAKNI